MGRFLDLIFPERVYRREQRAEDAARFDGIKKGIDGLHKLICGIAASRTKRDKKNDETVLKLFDRMCVLEEKIDSLKAAVEAAGKGTAQSEGVPARQVLSEYIYGENGDE